MNEKKVIVLGCGVSGLSCAIRLREAGYNSVTIWAKELPPYTTSNVAAAVWYPYKVAPEAEVIGWGRRGYQVFQELAQVEGSGVYMQTGLEVFRHEVPAPAWAAYVRNFRVAQPAELPAGYGFGYVFEIPMIETGVYLDFLLHQFKNLGGTVVQREVTNFEEVLQEAEIVVNCTGLGSRALAQDEAVFPIRGQIMRVTAPALLQTSPAGFVMAEDDHNDDGTTTYIVPRSKDCVLGGTIQENNWSLEVDIETAHQIQARCAALVPQVLHAEILEHLVGLRPGRKVVRLEALLQPDGNRLIHNYGHGGAGVTISWGCADEVVRLAQAVS